MRSIVFSLTITLYLAAFGFGQEKLSLPVKVTDVKMIAKTLMSKSVHGSKGEFETTADFEKRKNAAIAFPDGSTTDSTFTFVLTGQMGFLDKLEMGYDADSGTMNASLTARPFRDVLNGGRETPAAPMVEREFKRLPSTTGTSPLGVTKEIENSEASYYNVLFNNAKAFRIEGRSYSPVIKFPSVSLVPSVAQAAKPNLAVRYTVKLVAPYVGYLFVDIDPTVDKPRSIKSTTYHFYADVLEIVLFNNATGEVYARILPDGNRASPPPVLQ